LLSSIIGIGWRESIEKWEVSPGHSPKKEWIQPAAVRNEPLGFSFCSQLLSFVHNVVLPTHWITFIGNKGFREGMDMRIRVVKESFFNLAVL
jgi:hypothetical protein